MVNLLTRRQVLEVKPKQQATTTALLSNLRTRVQAVAHTPESDVAKILAVECLEEIQIGGTSMSRADFMSRVQGSTSYLLHQ